MGKVRTTRRRGDGATQGAESVLSPYAYQRLMASNRSRFAMYRWSRQSGKSMGCAIAINADILQVEADGRRTLWTLISRSLPQARELALKVRDVGRAVMAARKMLSGIAVKETADSLGETQLELTYPGGSRVVVVSGNPDAAAGYTGNVWWDEVGLTQRAAELFGTAFPVVSRHDYRFIMTSTPRPGFWKKRWDLAQKDGAKWFTHTLTIHDAIAQGCPMDAEELRAGLNDELRWRQEYLCEDVDDDICWLPWDMLMACTDHKATVAPADADGPVYAGWDVARWHDLSVLWLAEKAGGVFVTRGVVTMRRMPFDDQLSLIHTTLERYPRFTRLCIDQGGMGEMVVEQARRKWGYRVEGVKFTVDVKAVMAGDLRRLLEDRAVRLPDDDAVRADLHSVRCTTTAAGNRRFDGETKDSHADRFWALALALHAADGGAVSPLRYQRAARREMATGVIG